MKNITLFVLIVVLLTSCVGRSVSIIYFTDGTTVSCSAVRTGSEFTTCIHKTTFNESSDAYRNDQIEKIVAEPEK